MKKIILAFTIIVPTVLYIVIFTAIRNPTIPQGDRGNQINVNEENLRKHVKFLADINPSRSAQNIASLNIARDYIIKELQRYDCDLELQNFEAGGEQYTNVICSFGSNFSQTVVLGAHYDTHYDNNPGADDNASGVAGILEVARLINEMDTSLQHRIDIVAYTLEELPHFKSATMGSDVHAKSMRNTDRNIKFMISAEMIGYFSEEKNSQKFPILGMNLFYPTTADFIAIIGRLEDREITREVKRNMVSASNIDIYSLNAPNKIKEITFSDHASYWKYGYDAVMVTDTSFMRNPHYHKPTDTIETLNFTKMSEVVKGLFHVVIN